MEFQSPSQREVYEKVRRWMAELFGTGAVVAPPQAPVLFVRHAEAVGLVAVDPWGQDDATVTVRSYVVSGAPLTPELMRFLLEQNDTMRFGGFGVDGDGDIFFGHSFVGRQCELKELGAAVLAVVTTADEYDDRIRARWGGERAVDRMLRGS